jgi:hypothetical protein
MIFFKTPTRKAFRFRPVYFEVVAELHYQKITKTVLLYFYFSNFCVAKLLIFVLGKIQPLVTFFTTKTYILCLQ